MTSSRDTILRRVKDALTPLKERAPYPTYADHVATLAQVQEIPPAHVFKERLQLVGGVYLSDAASLAEMLRKAGLHHGYCDPTLLPLLAPVFGSDLTCDTSFDPSRVDDYQFGITRAAGAISETGTVILKDGQTSSRLGALAPWTHVAVLLEAEIVPSVSEALSLLGQDPNVVWCTGPSKTADVEGILIQGVHGPGIQAALVLTQLTSPA